jgi:GT2 family glycosyltransferase
MTDPDGLVIIIILNWNGWQDTIECVESCRKLSYENFRILIVDNGSTDGSEAILRGRFPDIGFIQTDSNLGFAGGNNVGIRYALEQGADYVWLLNNDTIVDPEALTELVRSAGIDAAAGIVGSKIYYYNEPNKIWFAGGMWRQIKSYARHRGVNEEDTGQYDDICEVDYISGCSLMIRSQVVREIGVMPEDYFLYWEEVDWNARAVARGWKILYVPKSVVWHKVSSSIGEDSPLHYRYSIRNALLFFQRHAPLRCIKVLGYVLYDAAKHYSNGKNDLAKAYLAGARDFFLRRFGAIR